MSDAQSGPPSSSTPFRAVIPAISETLVESDTSGPSDQNANGGEYIRGSESDQIEV